MSRLYKTTFYRIGKVSASLLISLGPLLLSAQTKTPNAPPVKIAAQIQSPPLRIEFDGELRSRVIARFGGKEIPLGPFSASETITGVNESWRNLAFAGQTSERISDGFGKGEKLTVTGNARSMQKKVEVTIYDDFPTLAVFDVSYTNTGKNSVHIQSWSNNSYTINAQPGVPAPAFWSYQSGSYEKRPNWVLPLKAGFAQQNYLGMNASDYGGGTPIIDVWRRDVGIGIGHIEPGPRLISLPVSMPDANHAHIAVTYKHERELAPGESFHTFRTFITLHQGDYFQTLTTYRKLMAKQGLQMPTPPEGAFGAIWCAWGYGRTVQLKQVYDTLPTVKKMGFTWVTLDDGWQNDYGDWQVDPKKFPHGDADMKALVDRIHQEGFKAQLWWSPLSASPDSKLLQEHPDLALENRDGSRRKISWWNTDYLCPADQDVVENQEAIVRKILVDWGFD
jgi:alpha-galactosidase